jgi:hypothetical protein
MSALTEAVNRNASEVGRKPVADLLASLIAGERKKQVGNDQADHKGQHSSESLENYANQRSGTESIVHSRLLSVFAVLPIRRAVDYVGKLTQLDVGRVTHPGGCGVKKDETDSADRNPLAFLLGRAKYRASGAILSTRQKPP